MTLVLLTCSEFGYAFGVLVYNIMQLTMRQRVCPPRLLGRMNASIRFVVWGVAARCAGRGLPRWTAGACDGHMAGRGVKPALRGASAVLALSGMRKLPDSVETGSS